MHRKTVFMIGMPASGKTTYLVSLCRMLLWGEQETVWRLDERKMPDGIEKIRELIEQLDTYHMVDRTRSTDFYQVQFPLLNEQQQECCFMVPDLSGEVFRDLVYDRRIKQTIMEQLVSADALLFFINYATMIPEERIKITEKLETMVIWEGENGENPPDKVETAETLQKKRCNQSAVIELLQCIVYLVRQPLNIKFVVSAWDLVEKEYGEQTPEPQVYIRRNFPMLYQYIAFNPSIIPEYWGVSAQGGDFENEQEVAELQRRNEGNLAYMVGHDMKKLKDITRLL